MFAYWAARRSSPFWRGSNVMNSAFYVLSNKPLSVSIGHQMAELFTFEVMTTVWLLSVGMSCRMLGQVVLSG